MSESRGTKPPVRPRQVTVAGIMAATACALLVVTLFDSMATVRSADMRGRIADFLDSPGGSGIGLGTSTVVDVLRGVVLLSGALAAAGVVLAVYVLRRHRGARIGLTVIACLMLFSATFVAGILPLVVVVAAAMLWGRDARDWFDGRAPRPRPAPDLPAPQDMTSWPPPQPGGPEPDPASAPAPAAHPFGSPPAPSYVEAPVGRPVGYPVGYPAPRSRAGGRPSAVSAAAWLTWVFSGLVAFGFLLVVLTLLVEPHQLVEELQRNPRVADQGFSGREVLGFLWVLSAVAITWALAASALAVLAYRRVPFGRTGLVVSAALTAVVSLLAVPVGWPNAAVAIACIVLLGRRSSRAWFAGHDAPAPGRPAPPPGEDPPVW